MKRVLTIGHNDIRIFLRGKAGYIWLFIVPVAFIYFMGNAMREPDSPSNPQPAVLLENADDGFLSRALTNALLQQQMRLVSEEEQAEAERGIRIPADFTRKVQGLEQAKVDFFKVAGSADPAAAMVELRLVRALVALNSHLFEAASSAPDDGPVTEAALERVMTNAPPVALDVSFAGRKQVPLGFNQSLPGVMVMYLLMNLLIFGGASVASERENGVIRRLAVYPLSRQELVLGKVYGRFLLGCVQIAFYLVLAQFVFEVRVDFNPLGVILTLVLFAWLSASLGVLAGSLTKGPEQTIPVCILAAMIMSALGGCWWPMELAPDTMKTVGHLFPTAWAMDALHKMISFKLGLGAIVTELLVLAGFAAAANILAGRFLRY